MSVYLDHNATTPMAPFLADKVQEWLSAWGNPSSIHQAGRRPKALLREARTKVSQLLGVEPLELVFTSGGSEANNLALKGVFEAFQTPNVLATRGYRNHYLLSSVEHPSSMRVADYLKARGAQVDFIPVSRDGLLDIDFLKAKVTEKTALVSVMMANNETGALFPLPEVVEIAHSKGALVHTDGVQALGKLQIKLKSLGVDLASFSGHKFYALRGVGVLFVKRGTPLESLIHGGGQERHRRGGTENVLAIASLGAMAERESEIEQRSKYLNELRNTMEARLKSEIMGLSVTAENSLRLPNTSSMVIPGVDGETLLMNLDMRGFEVSTGAACSSGSPEPSPVLLAMGLSRAEAQASLRVGLGWENTKEEIDMFIEALKEVVTHLRSFEKVTTPKNKELKFK
jgi:cysteine desulfurase